MRKLANFAGAFTVAIFQAVYLLPVSALLWIALGCLALSGIAVLLFKGKLRMRGLLLLLGFALGFSYHWGFYTFLYVPTQNLAGQTLPVTATALDYAQATKLGCRVDAEIPGARIRLYLDTDLDIHPGDMLELEVQLRPADQIRGEEVDYYRASGIDLLGYQEGELHLQRPEKLPFRFWFVYLRQQMSRKLAEVFPEDIAPFQQALVVGDKTEISQDTAAYAALDRSGIRHVIAISGMHLSFLVSMVRSLCGRRRRTALICIPLIVCFMALVGFPVSVVRAGIMQILLLIAPLLRRENDSLTSLAFAAFIILLLNPWAACSASFQLSFGAMAGITLFSGRLYAWLNEKLPAAKSGSRQPLCAVLHFITATLSSTFGAMLFTVPLMALHFGYISLVSPITNLLTLWAVSLCFILGLAACLLGFLWLPLGMSVAWFTAWPTRYILWIAGLLYRIPFAALYTESPYVTAFLLYLYGLLGLLLLFRKKKLRPAVPVSCALIVLCVTLLLSSLRLRGADMTLTAVDVGQGQSLILTSGSYTVVIDCGGNEGNAGDQTADFLASMGRDKIDLLVLTHWHDDHANGVEELLYRTQVDCLAIPYGTDDGDENAARLTTLAAKEARLVYVTEPVDFHYGQMQVQIFPPLGTGNQNEDCLSLLCSTGNYAALVTGDMSSRGEKALLERYSVGDVSLLVAGHHGSKNASCQEFLEELQPETVLISVGYNTYGHPAEETLERFVSIGAAVYRTDRCGNCTVRIKDG